MQVHGKGMGASYCEEVELIDGVVVVVVVVVVVAVPEVVPVDKAEMSITSCAAPR